MQVKNWNDLRYLLAVKRCGSISAVARQMKVDDTTVSRRLSVLHSSFGESVVHRLSGGALELTSRGELIVKHVEDAEHSFDQIEELLGGEPACAGVVRLTSVPIVVNQILIPQLSSLTQLYPELELELIPDSRDLSLTHREADLAIRLARPTAGGTQIKIRKIAELSCSVYASRDTQKLQVGKLPWVAYDDSLAHIPPDRWIRRVAAQRSEAISGIRVHDAESALQVTLAGLGKTVLPDCVAMSNKRLSKLRNVGTNSPPARELWLVGHARQMHIKRIEAVVNWIDSIFR